MKKKRTEPIFTKLPTISILEETKSFTRIVSTDCDTRWSNTCIGETIAIVRNSSLTIGTFSGDKSVMTILGLKAA